MLSAVAFKNRDPEVSSAEESTGSRSRDGSLRGWIRDIRRTSFYYIGIALLFVATLFILVALFTNNWIQTASYLVDNAYYTFGLWFVCKRYRYPINPSNFQGYSDVQGYDQGPSVFCQALDYDSGQIFYVIAALINLVALAMAYLGICVDISKTKLFVPSMLLWALLVSVGSQLIAISVYGGVGAGDYKWFVPDYSMILASFAIALDFFAAIIFAVECIWFKRKEERQAPY